MKFNCNCSKPYFFDKKYSYWEKREITTDENDILNKILLDTKLKNKDILHVGIGNSLVAKKIDSSNNIFGITISHKEIEYANSLKINNYKTIFCDKYSINLLKILNQRNFDLIIDTNLKSYTCCQEAFQYMMYNFFYILKPGGKIITSINGMKWYKSLKPKLTFSLKRLFYYKMKEVSGNPNNILKRSELEQLCNKHGIKILIDEKLCYLIK